MKIHRVADEKMAPSWAFDKGDKADFSNEALSQSEIDRIAEDLNEDQMVAERDHIEACAEKGSVYHYNSSWDKTAVSHLREYALACGMNLEKFKAVSPEYLEDIKTVHAKANRPGMVKQASTESETKIEMDPFKLDEKGDMSHIEEANWEDVKKQISLASRPSDMTNAIRPLRGGEDYFLNSDPKTAPGQNSITDPEAIENFAKTEDTGERLRKENEERAAQREKNHEAWEQEKIEAMADNDIVPKGTVFPTEVMNAQPGLDTSASKLANLKADDLPEKTEGEMIAEKNEEHRKSIQREEQQDDWQELKTASVRGISDSFTESLKKALGK